MTKGLFSGFTIELFLSRRVHQKSGSGVILATIPGTFSHKESSSTRSRVCTGSEQISLYFVDVAEQKTSHFVYWYRTTHLGYVHFGI
jgi:hypothetical protein